MEAENKDLSENKATRQDVFKKSFTLDAFEIRQLKFLLDNINYIYGDLTINKIKELL